MSRKTKRKAEKPQNLVVGTDSPPETATEVPRGVSLSPVQLKETPSGLWNSWMIASICAGIVGLTIIVFGQTYSFDFVNYDDNINVYQNYQVLRGLSWDSVVWAFSFRNRDYWHPFTMLSHAIDFHLFGLKAGGHHLHNVFWHAVTSVLVFWTLYDLTRKPGRSAIVAAVFAIHPLRAESVAWVSERKDVLSGVFFFLTILAYAHYVRNRSLKRYLLVVFLFLLGLASKPTLMPLPFLLLVLDYWPLGRIPDFFEKKGRTLFYLLLEKIPLVLLSIASVLEAAKGAKDAFEINKTLPLQSRVGNALVSYVIYLWQSIYPVNLSALYPLSIKSLEVTHVIVASVFLALFTCIAWYQRKRYPALIVGWLWYLGMLLPMIGLIQAGITAHADRYTYLAQAGVIISIVWILGEYWDKLPSIRVYMNVCAGVIIICFSALCYLQTAYWRDSETLWTRAIACTENNYPAYNNRGHSYYDKGKYEKALEDYSIATRINPNYSPINNNRALAYAKLNNHEMAVVYFTKAIMEKPKIAALYANRGHSFNFLDQYEAAIEDYTTVLELIRSEPDSLSLQSKIEVYNNRVFCYVMLKKYDKAWADVKTAEKLGYPLEDKLLNELKRVSNRTR